MINQVRTLTAEGLAVPARLAPGETTSEGDRQCPRGLDTAAHWTSRPLSLRQGDGRKRNS